MRGYYRAHVASSYPLYRRVYTFEACRTGVRTSKRLEMVEDDVSSMSYLRLFAGTIVRAANRGFSPALARVYTVKEAGSYSEARFYDRS